MQDTDKMVSSDKYKDEAPAIELLDEPPKRGEFLHGGFVADKEYECHICRPPQALSRYTCSTHRQYHDKILIKAGTIWKCDCGRCYKLILSQTSSNCYNDHWKSWFPPHEKWWRRGGRRNKKLEIV